MMNSKREKKNARKQNSSFEIIWWQWMVMRIKFDAPVKASEQE
jgi:hypothetical protein